MAGKSNKAKNKGKPTNSTPNFADSHLKPQDSAVSSDDSAVVTESTSGDAHEVGESQSLLTNGTVEVKEENGNDAAGDTSAETTKPAEGEIRLYPISVKTLSGEKLELQLSPGDTVMDIRQFLLEAPETCFFTCYELMLHANDDSVHHMEDYNEISEVADITIGGCSLEMVAALYDDRSIRSQLRRTRELLSLSNVHVSLSTELALQHEKAQQKIQEAKVETPEHEGLGFMEDMAGSLCNLAGSSPKDIKCVESITFSSFNPPPSYRRLVGDLIYLDATTLEGNKYCISGTTKGFYVNSSTGAILNPKPLKSAYEATTLVGLMQKISTKFKKGFREIMEKRASAHPFENVQSLLPPNSWLGVHPVPDHKRDAARAEDAFALSYGSESIGMQRDWNEELQSCREFSHTTLQERIMRDRALYKVTCDFVDAAVNGAVGVINRCIPPINPTDPECFHMYVHNNIFFSFAVDADLGMISKGQTNSKPAVLHENTSSLHSSVKASSNSDHRTNCETVACTSDSGKTEVEGCADGSSAAATEAQMADSEQATYASANNDLKGTRAYQEADVPGLYNLAMAIVDYRGHRVVAQSIIPGILQGDKSDSLLYGSVDNGKKICWNESFHSKVVEAAKHLHLKEHTVLDGSGNAVKLAAPVECKGIVGSDDRHYLLDLMRVTPRDSNFTGPGSRFCILRPELVAAFVQAEGAKASDSQATEEVPVASDSQDTVADVKDTSAEERKEVSENCPTKDETCKSRAELLLNPNVFTEFKLGASKEEIAADEAAVRKAGSYLMDVVLPKFVQDLCALDISPMDGLTLTDTLHAHGINVRYLGKVANMTKHLPHLWDLCTTEIIVRSAKHILKDTLRDSQDHDLGPAISHFFNCFLGNVLPSSEKDAADNVQPKSQKKDHSNSQSSRKLGKGRTKWSNGTSSRSSQPAYTSLTSQGLWSCIQEFAKFKYQFELPEDVKSRVKKVSVIRNLCQKVGVSIASRKYDLGSASPFQTSDILNLQPVVKHSVPVCSEAKDFMEAGKTRLAEGMLNDAYTLFSEAFSILQQVTGPMHREVANCCRYLAMVLYHAGDLAGAIMQQHKELIINERCLGLDHPDTAHSYGNMALFYHGLSQTELALRHMSRALLLLSLSSGPDHPDVAATFINIAMMYQDLGKMDTALRYLQEALKTNERLLGPEHIHTSVCYHALAIAFNCMGAYKLSLQHEKKTYEILKKQLGEDDPRTRESENWIKTFKVRELQVNAQKQKGQSLSSVSAQKAIDILKANPEIMQAIKATSTGAGNPSSSSMNKSLNAALIGDTVPRGRDERAAKAAADVRKKAAARGLLVRQNVTTPVQSLPLSQLLNIINNTSPATESSQSTEPKDSSNGPDANGVAVTEKGTNGSAEDRAPVGLGSGLASLDSKKQKQKPKSSA